MRQREDTYHDLHFIVCIPYSDHTGISADMQMASQLLPVYDRPDSVRNRPDDLAERTEGADKLHRCIAGGGVIVAIQPKYTIRYESHIQ